MSQKERILKHLESGKRLTAGGAYGLYGCFRLAARIFELRKKGHKIISEMKDVGNGKSVAIYFLEAE